MYPRSLIKAFTVPMMLANDTSVELWFSTEKINAWTNAQPDDYLHWSEGLEDSSVSHSMVVIYEKDDSLRVSCNL